MKKLLPTSAVLIASTGAFAQTTVTTTTGVGRATAVQIEPQYRTRIHSYVTEHKIRPVQTRRRLSLARRCLAMSNWMRFRRNGDSL